MTTVLNEKSAANTLWQHARSYGWLAKTYLVALAVYTFCFLPFFSTYRSAETVLVALFLGMVFFSKRTRYLRSPVLKDPIFRLCLLLLVFLLCAQVWYAVTLPDFVQPSMKVTRHYLKPLMVLLVAIGISLAGKRAPWLLLITAATGMAVYLAIEFNTSEWSRALSGKRVDFGIHNAQHTGMFFGTALLGTLCFLPRIGSSQRNLKCRVPAVLIALFILMFVMFGTVVTQTRAVWLGLLAALGIAVIIGPVLFAKRKRKTGKALKYAGLGLVVTCLLAGVAISEFNVEKTVEQRFNAAHIDLGNLIDEPSKAANPTDSSSVRMMSWRVAGDWFSQRPLLGWGAGTTSELIDHSDYFSKRFKGTFGHLHNTFVETVIAHGLIGSAILLTLMAWIGLSTIKAHRRGDMPTDVFIFACCFFAFWCVINLFESYILYPTGQYLNAIIVGFIYSFHFRTQVRNDAP